MFDLRSYARYVLVKINFSVRKELLTRSIKSYIDALTRKVGLFTVSACHTPGHYTQKPGIVTKGFGEHAGVATIVQGTKVQEDSCPRDFCPMKQLSKQTLVQGDCCPRKRLLVKSLLKLIFLFFY